MRKSLVFLLFALSISSVSIAERYVGIDKGFVTDDGSSAAPAPAEADGNILDVNHALGLILLLASK